MNLFNTIITINDKMSIRSVAFRASRCPRTDYFTGSRNKFS